MYWVYVLGCENDTYYVGETSKLFSRLHNHIKGVGSVNTKKNKVEKLVGLYRVPMLYRFLHYKENIDNNKTEDKEQMIKYLKYFNLLDSTKDMSNYCENFITEEIYNSEKEVRGGKYTKDKVEIPKRTSNYPLCNCGIPCEIKKKNLTPTKWKLYYCCSLNNIWDEMLESIKDIELGKSCNYYKEYLDDIEFRVLIQDLT